MLNTQTISVIIFCQTYDFLVQMPWGDRPAVMKVDKYTKKIDHQCVVNYRPIFIGSQSQHNAIIWLQPFLAFVYNFKIFIMMALPDAHNIQKCVFLIVFVTFKSINKKMFFIFSLCTILTVPFNCLEKKNKKKNS